MFIGPLRDGTILVGQAWAQNQSILITFFSLQTTFAQYLHSTQAAGHLKSSSAFNTMVDLDTEILGSLLLLVRSHLEDKAEPC